MRNIITKLLLISTIIILSGCATSIPLSASNKNKVKTIQVDVKKTTAENFFYIGPSSTLLILGLPGIIASTAVTENSKKKLTKLVRSHNVYIEDIVKQEMLRQLKEYTPFHITQNNNYDAIMHIIISSYGLSAPTTISKNLKPELAITAWLTDSNGAIIWRSSSKVFGYTSGMPTHTMNEYIKNPSYFKDVWQVAAHKVIGEIVSTLS